MIVANEYLTFIDVANFTLSIPDDELSFGCPDSYQQMNGNYQL
jgi:hypothetical protein